jgi:hypothetical protein
MVHSSVQVHLPWSSIGISSIQFYGGGLAVKELSLPLWQQYPHKFALLCNFAILSLSPQHYPSRTGRSYFYEKYHYNHWHKPLAFQNKIKVIFRISVTLFSSVRLKEAITKQFKCCWMWFSNHDTWIVHVP